MHLKTKKLTVSAMLLAVSVLLVYMGNMMESSTLFFLAAASFGVGLMQREYGTGSGCVLWIATVILGFLLVPQKLYLLTYSVFALYILCTEVIWGRLCRTQEEKKRKITFVLARLAVFLALYIPLVIALPRLILNTALTQKAGGLLYPVLIGFGLCFLVLFDRAYCYFQGVVWEKIRRVLKL